MTIQVNDIHSDWYQNEKLKEIVTATGLTNSVVWLGLDSLTAGSGSFSYDIVLEKLGRGAVGWGGRWVPFGDATLFGETTIFKQQVTTLAGLPLSDSRRNRGLDGNGIFAAAGSNAIMLLEPNFNWSYCDLYYLQQPSGGTFTIDRPLGQASIPVDTNGPLSLQKVRITKNLRNGTGPSNTNGVRISNSAVAAEFVAYGVMFYSGDAGPVYVNAAQGGRKVSDQLLFDETFQKQWFDMLGVTHVVMNGGMNDRTVSSPSVFQSDLTAVLNRFPKDTKFIIQRPNDPSDNLIAQYDSVYQSVATQFNADYIDTLALFGNYAAFNGRGWMLDGVHPNQHYQIRQAQEVCIRLFGKCRYENTPAVINYVGGDTQ